MLYPVQITCTQHPLAAEWWQLYEEAFPVTERRAQPQHAAALQNLAFHCIHLSDENGFAGIMAYWKWEKMIYLEHLAICATRRNLGLGHQALKLLQGDVIVEIEPANDSESVRRLAFYESCGFYCLPQPHVQLAYQTGQPDVPLWLLSRPAFNAELVEIFEKLYHDGPMQYRDM